jgi:uncharacterized protein YcfJ
MLKKILSTIAVLLLPLAAFATEYRTVDTPRQECWNEQVPVQSAGSGYGGAVIGGIAGGLLGNQVGGGNGKTVATAVGAATGAVVGDRMSSNSPGYRSVQRCRTVIDHRQVAVYRQPVQVIRQPVQIVERVYYVDREEGRHRGKHKKKHHGHGRGHDDDDDD